MRSRCESDAGDHLGDAGRHHLRHGARRDAVERDGECRRARSSTRRRAAPCSTRARQTLVGHVHADQHRQLQRATATVAITVVKATPVITWATPAAITYGTALGAAQLNATANAPGTFSYTPASGVGARRGREPDPAGHLHAGQHRQLQRGDGDRPLTVKKATPTITWAGAGAITYRHAARRDAVERDGECAGHVHVYAAERNGPRGRPADALGGLHSGQPRQLQRGHEGGDDHSRDRHRHGDGELEQRPSLFGVPIKLTATIVPRQPPDR